MYTKLVSTHIKQLNLKNCDMIIWYANNLFTLQGLPNLTNPGHFNNDISLTQQVKVLVQVCIVYFNRYTILLTITCCSLTHEN